ncbi:vascular endothelial growth factor receptor 1-like, partial [Augochlora pura]
MLHAVDNRYKKKSLNFTLDVLAEPEVYINTSRSYYFHNQVALVECHVEAFPRPNITWSYRKCPNYPSCDDGILEYLTNSRENGTMTHLVSIVSATLQTSGELTCSACNDIGCGRATENVSVSDEVGEFGIILTMDSVVEGDEWKLICAASIRNYSDIFDWWNESGPIVQSERISIDRQRTQFMHRSILEIRSVKIEDSQEYICTGKAMDNYIRSAGYRLEVIAARAPIIADTNLKKDEIIFDLNTRERKSVDFYCFADGVPKPSIRWFKVVNLELTLERLCGTAVRSR